MEKTNIPLLCDPKHGLCEIPTNLYAESRDKLSSESKPVRIIYFTDPICSACWAIEPQLRKLKLEYGTSVEIEYRMGGLLPDWNYQKGGISKPSDVAHHWDEASRYYQMPIDGDVWLEDPLHSSYPPSIAFKAAQMQDSTKAIRFLRIIREMVFLEKKNIAHWEHLSTAATLVGLSPEKLKHDSADLAVTLFRADLELTRKIGVRGFPTLFVINNSGHKEYIYGFKPYSVFESTIAKVCPNAPRSNYSKNWEHLFKIYPTQTLREFAELSDLTPSQSEELLEKLVHEGELTKQIIKNGTLWKRKIMAAENNFSL
ncbi:MAG: ClpXP adapter SpxH family protein [Breznakibacter sp.]